jgi:hypothetical protein
MTTTGLSRLEPLQNVRAGIQEVAYYQAGPADGDPVLLHGYEGMIPWLADGGLRVLVPNLRRARPTRFLDPSSPRSGQQPPLEVAALRSQNALQVGKD